MWKDSRKKVILVKVFFVIFQIKERLNQEFLRAIHLQRHPNLQTHRLEENLPVMLQEIHKTNEKCLVYVHVVHDVMFSGFKGYIYLETVNIYL